MYTFLYGRTAVIIIIIIREKYSILKLFQSF